MSALRIESEYTRIFCASLTKHFFDYIDPLVELHLVNLANLFGEGYSLVKLARCFIPHFHHDARELPKAGEVCQVFRSHKGERCLIHGPVGEYRDNSDAVRFVELKRTHRHGRGTYSIHA